MDSNKKHYRFWRNINILRGFIDWTGNNLNAAAMLARLMHWSDVTGKDWIYKTRTDWEDELGFSRWEQETSRKLLKDLGLIMEEKRGMPPKMYFCLTPKFRKMIELNRNTDRERKPPNGGGGRERKPPHVRRETDHSCGEKTSNPYSRRHREDNKGAPPTLIASGGEPVFRGRVGKIVREYFNWATTKHYFDGKKKPNLQEWGVALVKLKESHSDSLDWIEEVLDWYYTTKDLWHPRCQYLTTFCKKFESIERAYCRDTKTPLPSNEEDSPRVTKNNVLPPRVMTFEDIMAEED